ncbi:MAG: hypothetical protein QOF70_6877 [Acetobacteraceae bacterium]|jgi:hypothetical protein|nr:hypothetical protein [Acetobacteraceae bacterium]
MLGDTGEVSRVAALATIYCGGDDPERWVVEAVDASGDGGIFTTLFLGPCAQERAREYAQEKYSGFRPRGRDQLPYR